MTRMPDRFLGTTGDDFFIVPDRDDGAVSPFIVYGRNGQDTLIGSYNIERNILLGGDDSDLVIGGFGARMASAFGENGHDMLIMGASRNLVDDDAGSMHFGSGGAGDDILRVTQLTSSHVTLSGGSGADSFEFTSCLGKGEIDVTIADFTSGEDVIKLNDAVTGSFEVVFGFEDLIFTQAGANTLVTVNPDTDLGAAGEFGLNLTMLGVRAEDLTADDFVFA